MSRVIPFRQGIWLLLCLAGLAREIAVARAEVQVEICESGLDDKDAWPETAPVATEFFSVSAFAIDQIPPKYVDDGIRGTRPSPSLVRLTGTVDFPSGKHRILIRARSAARLTLNGTLLVETPFAPKNG
ncbi:MAG: hypothetical protein NT069_29915, partial [Planctomycetota bacterium]|nr:hypothetical protein [Planctomycetota bacterium]